METLIITIVGVLLILVSIFLIFAVLMQSAKNSRMSGVVSGGGAETFFGKYKGKTIDKKLNKLTIIVSIIFAAVVIALYIIQPGEGKVDYGNPNDIFDSVQVTTTASADTTEEAGAVTTDADAASDDSDVAADDAENTDVTEAES
ncbi:MAG: preprotein translocase subunit SecG [Eubacteriales bacterium]